jgi:hypothetical protein
MTSETPAERYDVGSLYSARPAPGLISGHRAGYVDGVAELPFSRHY